MCCVQNFRTNMGRKQNVPAESLRWEPIEGKGHNVGVRMWDTDLANAEAIREVLINSRNFCGQHSLSAVIRWSLWYTWAQLCEQTQENRNEHAK